MYTPRLNTRRWFGSHNAPATRPDNERQGAAYAPVVQLHDEIDRLFDGMFRGMMNPKRRKRLLKFTVRKQWVHYLAPPVLLFSIPKSASSGISPNVS